MPLVGDLRPPPRGVSWQQEANDLGAHSGSVGHTDTGSFTRDVLVAYNHQLPWRTYCAHIASDTLPYASPRGNVVPLNANKVLYLHNLGDLGVDAKLCDVLPYLFPRTSQTCFLRRFWEDAKQYVRHIVREHVAPQNNHNSNVKDHRSP